MAEPLLDTIAKWLAKPATRRGVLRRAGAGLATMAAASLFPHRARAYGLIQCTPGSGTAECPPSTTCIAGLCLQPYQSSYCPPGSSYCGGQCVNTQTDPNHCGGCNTPCPPGIGCTYGACTIVVPNAPPQAAVTPVCSPSQSQSAAGSTPSVSVSSRLGIVAATASGGSGQITLAQCAANPGPGAPAGVNDFFDLQVSPGSSYAAVTLTVCPATASPALVWLNPAAGWQPVSPAPAVSAAGCLTVTFTAATSPSIEQLTGTPFGAGAGCGNCPGGSCCVATNTTTASGQAIAAGSCVSGGVDACATNFSCSICTNGICTSVCTGGMCCNGGAGACDSGGGCATPNGFCGCADPNAVCQGGQCVCADGKPAPPGGCAIACSTGNNPCTAAGQCCSVGSGTGVCVSSCAATGCFTCSSNGFCVPCFEAQMCCLEDASGNHIGCVAPSSCPGQCCINQVCGSCTGNTCCASDGMSCITPGPCAVIGAGGVCVTCKSLNLCCDPTTHECTQSCSGGLCCDPGTSGCVGNGDACSAANTICVGGTCQPCGGSGQPCCAGNACASGCCVGGVCGPACPNGCCDPANNNCVAAGTPCSTPGEVCFGAHCVACGGAMQPCCVDANSPCSNGGCCDPGNQICVADGSNCAEPAPNRAVCSSGICTPCGQQNEICCSGPGAICNPPLSCVLNPNPLSSEGTCQPCGAQGQVCCGGLNGTCNAGLSCQTSLLGASSCEPCGQLNQPCCPVPYLPCSAGTVCQTTLLNPTGTCVGCGGSQQPCCDGGICNSGTCQSGVCAGGCPASNSTCTGGTTFCSLQDAGEPFCRAVCCPSNATCPTGGPTASCVCTTTDAFGNQGVFAQCITNNTQPNAPYIFACCAGTACADNDSSNTGLGPGGVGVCCPVAQTCCSYGPLDLSKGTGLQGQEACQTVGTGPLSVAPVCCAPGYTCCPGTGTNNPSTCCPSGSSCTAPGVCTPNTSGPCPGTCVACAPGCACENGTCTGAGCSGSCVACAPAGCQCFPNSGSSGPGSCALSI